MNVLNFGSMNLDQVYQVPHFALPGETLPVAAFQENAGGKGLNQSIALARAGARVFHAGCVGVGGEMLMGMLRENGVDTGFVRPCALPQGRALIQVAPDGENSILLYGGSNRAVTKAQIDETLEHFAPGDLLLAQNEVSELPYLIGRAKARGLTVALNPSPFDDVTARLDYGKVDWIIMNALESALLTGEAEPLLSWEKLHRRFPALQAVITLGGQGSLLCLPGREVFRQPIVKVKAVDTTGAGDTFTGFFFASLLAGKTPEAAMRRAAAAAAICVSRMGAAPAIPYAEEVCV